jgi:Tol biopolymer transport system component
MQLLRTAALPLCLALVLSACGAPGTSGSATTTADTPISSPAVPTAEPTIAPTAVPTVDPVAYATGSGLSLSTADGLLQIDTDGKMDQIVDQSSARLSPDSHQVAFLQPDPDTGADDVWLLDRTSGEKIDLTNTPDRFEMAPMWWPGRPNVIVFGSDTEAGMGNEGHPTVVNTDGSGYRVLDESQGGPRALSPDGSAIAYGGYDSPGAIFTWDGGVSPFNPSDYGVEADKLIQPAFSPDGARLAWLLAKSDPEGGNSTLGLAVFDLTARTGQLYHTYQPVGGGSSPYDVKWSPAGEWIAFTTFGEPPASGRAPNLWVIHPDGSGETLVGEGLNPVWSPDGSQLAYLRTGADGNQEIWLAPSSSWQPAQLSLPDQAKRTLFLMGWTAP